MGTPPASMPRVTRWTSWTLYHLHQKWPNLNILIREATKSTPIYTQRPPPPPPLCPSTWVPPRHHPQCTLPNFYPMLGPKWQDPMHKGLFRKTTGMQLQEWPEQTSILQSHSPCPTLLWTYQHNKQWSHIGYTPSPLPSQWSAILKIQQAWRDTIASPKYHMLFPHMCNPKSKEKCKIECIIVAYRHPINIGNLLSHCNLNTNPTVPPVSSY